MVVYRKMLTKDEQKNQNADVHNCSIDDAQNTNLDAVLLGKRVKIARKEKRLTRKNSQAFVTARQLTFATFSPREGECGCEGSEVEKMEGREGSVDNPGADPQVKINSEIAPNLA